MRASQMTAAGLGNIPFHYLVGGELTVYTLPSIQHVLQQQLTHDNEIEVDFSQVRIVDSMGVRAILAIRREALRNNRALHFVSRNEAFLKLLDFMNHAEFGADPAITTGKS